MAIAEKILDFGKNKGRALGVCEEGYIKWLAQHPKRLREDHRHFAIAAKALLEKKEEKVALQPTLATYKSGGFDVERSCKATIEASKAVFSLDEMFIAMMSCYKQTDPDSSDTDGEPTARQVRGCLSYLAVQNSNGMYQAKGA